MPWRWRKGGSDAALFYLRRGWWPQCNRDRMGGAEVGREVNIEGMRMIYCGVGRNRLAKPCMEGQAGA